MTAVDVSPDQLHVVTAGQDGAVRLWDAGTADACLAEWETLHEVRTASLSLPLPATRRDAPEGLSLPLRHTPPLSDTQTYTHTEPKRHGAHSL